MRWPKIAEAAWKFIRAQGPRFFPLIAVFWVLLIIASPFLHRYLPAFIGNDFVRFVLFWMLSVLIIISVNTRAIKPWKIGVGAVLVSSLVLLVYFYVSSLTGNINSPVNLLFACLSGAVLGALAGNWGLYVLEMYMDDPFE